MEKIQVEILKDGVRLDGVDRQIGDIVEMPQYLLETWLEKGYCKIKRNEPSTTTNPQADADETENLDNQENPEESGIKHKGGGYYLLPNGEKVKGKEAAIEAIKALKGGEENGTEADSGTNDGAGDDTGSGD